MRPASIMLALALAACSVPSSAADVEFEARGDLFEKPTGPKPNFVNFSYDSPLYEGLWPMTIEAFQTLDCPKNEDKEIRTFCIAANDVHLLRRSLWKSTRQKFAELEAEYVFGGIAFTR